MAERYGNSAKEKVEKISNELPQNEYKEILISAMEELYKRDK